MAGTAAGSTGPDWSRMVTSVDMLMPSHDGLAVLAELRRADPTARVAMLSSLREEDKVERAIALGASDYVVKPVLFKQLHECVDRLASQPD